ncbi:MAG: MFS transporter [Actinobacteria bacterium]|nr:MAG: MFS transporter [Actinomycetota bacterium]
MSWTAGQDSGGGFRAAIKASGFRRLLIGQAVSSLGDWVATLAFIAAAFTLTHGNQTAVAVVLVLRLVPPIFAAPVGGVVADRVYRRTIMVTCDLTRAALIALAPFVGIGLLYAIAFVHESISLFFLPARDASVPLLVPNGALAEANGLVLATSYGSIPVAAALFSGLSAVESRIPHALPFAGLFTRHRNTLAFFFDAATFVFSASMIAQLQLKRARRQQVQIVEGVVEGFRYVIAKQGLRSLALGVVVSMFGGGVLFAVGIGYIHQTLGGSDVAFGWLTALWGAGMGIGLALVRLLIKDRGRAPTFLLAVTMCGAVLIVMALLPFLWLAFVAAVVFGTAFSVAILVALTTAQEMTEDRIRGRIMGGVQMLFRVGLGAGALGVGALAHYVRHVKLIISLDGNQVGLIAGGILIILGAVAASGLRLAGAGTGP